LLWPFEFRDCYSYNTETNLYSLSHAFSERIADLNAWTMDTCFFDPWPEFKSDIPVFNSIPASMPAKAGALITANRSHQEAIQETIQETEWSAIDPVTTLLHWNVSDSMTVEA
jgi:hypothetical protein